MQSANATETRDESGKIVGFALEGKYRAAAVRRGLDLLFYVNLGMQTAWGIEDGARPGVQALVAQGWRSVSYETKFKCMISNEDFMQPPRRA